MTQQPPGLATMMTLNLRLFPLFYLSQSLSVERAPSVQIRSQRTCKCGPCEGTGHVHERPGIQTQTFQVPIQCPFHAAGQPFSGIIPGLGGGHTSHGWLFTWKHRARIFCGGYIGLTCGLYSPSLQNPASLPTPLASACTPRLCPLSFGEGVEFDPLPPTEVR